MSTSGRPWHTAAFPLQAAYCASKHAVLGFFGSLRTELLHDHSNVQTTMVQMPALNTPQFGWVKSRLAAEGTAGAADLSAGGSGAGHLLRRSSSRTAGILRGVVSGRSGGWATSSRRPSPTDYLARTGYDSQQYDGAEDPNRPNNLWEPVAGDHGAHGTFDDRARNSSLELLAETHWKWLAAAALGTIAAIATVSKTNSDDHLVKGRKAA